MRFSKFLPFLLLGACAPHPQTTILTQKVYCVTAEQYRQLVNAEPDKVGHNLTGNAQLDFKIAAGSSILLRNYADGLLKVIGGCTGPAPSGV